jgi:hypothetical protein
MKIGQSIPGQGSFGLTPEMKAQVENYHTKKVVAEKGGDVVDENSPWSNLPTIADYVEDQELEADPAPVVENETIKKAVSTNPLEALKTIGVELTDDDFSKIVFRGYLEKEVVVIPSIRNTRPLVATFRTLVGREIDEADELMAEDISQDVKMTNQGYDVRRSMWQLSYGVTQLMGKPVAHDVKFAKSEKINSKGTAREKRKVLSALSPAILAKMMNIHNVLTISINAIVADPEADYLKKP